MQHSLLVYFFRLNHVLFLGIYDLSLILLGGVKMDMFNTFDQKISFAVEKIKALKEEHNKLAKRITELEDIIRTRDSEIDKITKERNSSRNQIEMILSELEAIEL